MKNLLLIALLIPAIAFSQSKKDTKIIVTVSDTTNIVNRVALALYENGYSLEQKDEQLKFLATTEKGFSSYSVKIRAFIKDSAIVFTGVLASTIGIQLGMFKTERAFEPIFYGGMKKSPLRLSWEEINSIALKFGNNVTYSK